MIKDFGVCAEAYDLLDYWSFIAGGLRCPQDALQPASLTLGPY